MWILPHCSLLAVSFVPIDSAVQPLTAYVRHDSVTWTQPGEEYFSLYRAEWERSAQTSGEAMAVVSDYLRRMFSAKEMFLVGHNVGFDLSFLKQISGGRPFPRLSHRTVDTHTMLRVLGWLGRIPESACSSSGAFEHFGISPPSGKRHTSLGDATATRELFVRLLAEYDEALGCSAPP